MFNESDKWNQMSDFKDWVLFTLLCHATDMIYDMIWWQTWILQVMKQSINKNPVIPIVISDDSEAKDLGQHHGKYLN